MRAGQGIIVISIALLMLGVIMVNSAGMQISQQPLHLSDILTSRPTLLALCAIIAMYCGSRFPLSILQKNLWKVPLVLWLFPVTIVLLLAVYAPAIGKEVNYSNRWIDIGGFNFQPSEIAKWSMVLLVAFWGSKHFSNMQNFWKGFIPPMIGMSSIVAIIAVEDLGTAVLVFIVACTILFASGAKLVYFAPLAPIGAGGLAFAFLSSPYRWARIQTYLHPFAAPEGDGYHILQSMSAISEGGLAGLGLGNGIHKFGYLPEDTTDFIYSVICEELGFFGSFAVASLYVGLVVLGVLIIKKTATTFQQLLALGIITTVGFQAAMNILVVTALIPTKGIALPLLSNGGTGWLLTAFCIGLIDAIDRNNASSVTKFTNQTTSFSRTNA